MSRTYEIEATFEAFDDEDAAYIEQRLRSFGCTNVFVTPDETKPDPPFSMPCGWSGYDLNNHVMLHRAKGENPDCEPVPLDTKADDDYVESGPVDEAIGEQRCADCGALVGHRHVPGAQTEGDERHAEGSG